MCYLFPKTDVFIFKTLWKEVRQKGVIGNGRISSFKRGGFLNREGFLWFFKSVGANYDINDSDSRSNTVVAPYP